MRLKALEVGFEIVCAGRGGPALARAIEQAWDWCADDEPSAPDHRLTVVLEEDHDLLAPQVTGADLFGQDLDRVMDRLSPLITRLAVIERAEDLTMLHACALADPATGHVAVLYGPSGTGKTTMARTLGTDLAYLSDETSAVTHDLRVVPYPKPLSIIGTPSTGYKAQVSPGALGLQPLASIPYRLRALVQLSRVPAHVGDATWEALPILDALPELVAQTSFTRDMTRPLHRLAGLASQVGGIQRATYAEASQLRPMVWSLLQGET